MAHFLVTSSQGPEWDSTKTRRTQARFDLHGDFLEGLVAQGVILHGGPLGEDPDHGDALLLVEATDEADVRSILAPDPWTNSILRISSVQRWTLWLGTPLD